MLQLKINGKLFGGWTEAAITRGIDQLAGTFDIKVTDRWENQQWSISPFDSCQVLWSGKTVITGYVDSVSISYDAGSHEITIAGRSKTADLVDCSAASSQYKNQSLSQIAAALCQPFGIDVKTEASAGGAFLSYKPDEGVQVFEALEKLAGLRGLLLMDNAAGDLVITQAGTDRISTALKMPGNIKSGSGNFNVKDRFSVYTVKGQQKGGDQISPEFAAHNKASITDTNVTRYRPTILQAEDQADLSTVKKRAQWESNIRFGLSQSFRYTVQGWEHKNGLWQPNTLVHVKDKYMGVDTDLIIASITYLLGSNGTTTELVLAHRKAFIAEPIDTPVKSKNSVTHKKSYTGPKWQELNP